jgi:hypothetical protein
MPQATVLLRWRTALARAARRTLGARWRSTLEALEATRLEYRTLHATAAVDARVLRRVARRVRALEQLRTVLARELWVGG